MSKVDYPWLAVALAAMGAGVVAAIASLTGAETQIAVIAGAVAWMPLHWHVQHEAGRRGIPLWKLADSLDAVSALVLIGGGLALFGVVLAASSAGLPDAAVLGLLVSGVLGVGYVALFLVAKSSPFVSGASPRT